MKIKSKSNKKFITITSLVVIIAASALGVYAYMGSRSQQVTSESDSTNGSNSQSDISKPKNDTPKGSGRNFADEPTVTPQKAKLDINTLVQSEGKVHVVATVHMMPKKGQCTVYLTSEVGSDIVSKSLTITETSDGIKCEAEISENEFSYLGKWNARATYSASDKIVEDTGSLIIK